MQTYVGNVLKWREKKREIEMCMWVLRVKLKGEGQKKAWCVIFDSIIHLLMAIICNIGHEMDMNDHQMAIQCPPIVFFNAPGMAV